MDRIKENIKNVGSPCLLDVSPELREAVKYLLTIKDVTSGSQLYDQLLDLMRKITFKEVNKNEFERLINDIFKEFPQYLNNFISYLPEPYNLPLLQRNPEVSSTFDLDKAIKYIQKVKEQLRHNPTLYWSFIETLDKYQSDVKSMVKGELHNLSAEDIVFRKMTSLFAGETQIMNDFFELFPEIRSVGDTLSDVFSETPATSQIRNTHLSEISHNGMMGSVKRPSSPVNRPSKKAVSEDVQVVSDDDQTGGTSTPPMHFDRSAEDRIESLSEAAFFDCLRKTIDYNRYETFIKHVSLYMDNTIPYNRLIQHCNDIFGEYPSLVSQFESLTSRWENKGEICSSVIDKTALSMLKRYGDSYRQIPFTEVVIKGASEILNTKYVSYPTQHEDDTIRARKNSYEEHLIRCDDARIDFDYHSVTTFEVIAKLRGVYDCISRMESPLSVRLTDSLGVESPMLVHCVLHRVYSSDYLTVVDSIKRVPFKVIPVVINRLEIVYNSLNCKKKGLYKEWNSMQSKLLLKSLDYGVHLKSCDIKTMRSHALFDDINTKPNDNKEPRELNLCYYNAQIIEDTNDLLIYYVRRYNMSKLEKTISKRLIRSFIPDLLFTQRKCLSDDEDVLEFDNTHNDVNLFYGGSHWYCFIRLHNLLCSRLSTLLRTINEKTYQIPVSTTAKRLGYAQETLVVPDDCYEFSLQMIRDHLDGLLDSTTFEDRLRSFVGVNSYVVFTVESLLHYAVKNLHRIVSSECDNYVHMFYTRTNHYDYYHTLLQPKDFYQFVFNKNPLSVKITLFPLPPKCKYPKKPYLIKNLTYVNNMINSRGIIADDFILMIKNGHLLEKNEFMMIRRRNSELDILWRRKVKIQLQSSSCWVRDLFLDVN